MKKLSLFAVVVVAVAAVWFFLRSKPSGEAPSATAPASSAPPPGAGAETLTVYSGRSEKLVGAVLESFEAETGIQVRVRYGETPQLLALLLEEGERTSADVYIAQDAGALGALSKAGRFETLPAPILERVWDARFKAKAGDWVGISGRARVLAYNTAQVKADELPSSVFDLTAPKWKGRIGWAPTNASFQAFMTAMRELKGEAETTRWLTGLKANAPRTYKNNTAIVEALARGEVSVGLVNHYYLFAAEKGRAEPLPVANHYFAKDDAGALVNVAGVGILKGSKNAAAARKLVEHLLSVSAQTHFAKQTFEYPLSAEVAIDPRLKSIAEVGSPALDLSRLEDLQGTVRLLQQQGVL